MTQREEGAQGAAPLDVRTLRGRRWRTWSGISRPVHDGNVIALAGVYRTCRYENVCRSEAHV